MHRRTLPKLLPTLALLALLPLATGCDQIAELLELPNPERDAARMEAEGRAIGSGCRHSGRSLEDCYTLNPSADKAAVFAGWRDMNDYMLERKLEVVPAQLTQLPTLPGTPAATDPSAAAASPAAGSPAQPPAQAPATR